jgi:predicted TIM-barrel fold metal-dependent hydrolase
MGNWSSRDPVEGCRIRRQEGCRIASSTICVKTSLFTSSGVFDQAAPNCAIAELGIDHVLFSIDDPFGDNFEAVEFLNKAQLSQENKEKLAHGNAERVLKLLPETTSRRGELRS